MITNSPEQYLLPQTEIGPSKRMVDQKDTPEGHTVEERERPGVN